LQRAGAQAEFEERAVDFAVTFEQSPPSWVELPSLAEVAETPALPKDAYYLSGDIRSCKFEDLKPVFEKHRLPILDFSGVRRIDFFSAGQLANRLGIFKHGGREIIIRSPNHLVAELMGVVGINKYARILVPKS
jgi:anti-anti-sigma regulatory factor